MRQVVGRCILAAALASASAVACEDNDDETTTDQDNVGSGSNRDSGTTSRDGGGTSGGDTNGTSGNGDGSGGGAAEDGGGSAEDEADAGTTSDIDGGASSDGGARGDGGPRADAGDAQAEVELTDPEIGAVTSALNMGEVAQANAALPKLTNQEAQAFAQEMVTAHNAAQMRQAALLQRKGIAPAENAVSTALRQESDAIVAQLTAATTDVDRLYIETQVEVHAKALETLDGVLIPSAEDPELKAELEATRAEVKMHHDHAEEVLDALGG